MHAADPPQPQAPPNIVFAFSDEHRWQSMSFTATPELKTPTMDRLAKAEYAHMPADMRTKVMSLSLPDRIAWQNIEAVQFSKTQKGGGALTDDE